MLAVRERNRGGTVVDGPPLTPGGSVLMQSKHGISVPRSLIEDCADYAGLDPEVAIRDDYSGRGMYHATCLGIVYDRLGDLLGFVAGLIANDEDHLEWISRVRQDNMGMSMIAYWPGVSIAEDER
jgi:hypothetical protein